MSGDNCSTQQPGHTFPQQLEYEGPWDRVFPAPAEGDTSNNKAWVATCL